MVQSRKGLWQERPILLCKEGPVHNLVTSGLCVKVGPDLTPTSAVLLSTLECVLRRLFSQATGPHRAQFS